MTYYCPLCGQGTCDYGCPSGLGTYPDLLLPNAALICRLTGLTYRQVDYLIRTERVVPTVNPTGSGHRRGFTLDDAVALVVANIAIRYSLDIDPRTPPALTDVQRGVSIAIDVDEIRDDLERRWPRTYATTAVAA